MSIESHSTHPTPTKKIKTIEVNLNYSIPFAERNKRVSWFQEFGFFYESI